MVRRGLLIVLDGVGVPAVSAEQTSEGASRGGLDAVSSARTPTLDSLKKKYPNTVLGASGESVGLPDGIAGNSEVGHITLGAGRAVAQDMLRIREALESGALDENPALKAMAANLKARRGARLHLIGLFSTGAVHSHWSHWSGMVRCLGRLGIESIQVHAILDGRDSAPTQGRGLLAQFEELFPDGGRAQVVSVCGRFFAMDRNQNWQRTEIAYRLLAQGKADRVPNLPSAVLAHYDRGTTDEYIPPTCLSSFSGIRDGDAILWMNFRSDRIRQIVRAFHQVEFPQFTRDRLPTLSASASLTAYENPSLVSVLVERPFPEKGVGEIVSQKGLKQLRIAETEKYAHVSSFFNGGREEAWPGEHRVLVPSRRDVRSFDLSPEMSAAQIVDRCLGEFSKQDYALTVINFANADMVAHTGNFPATVKAVEEVDTQLGRLLDKLSGKYDFAVVTADHGNAEQMLDAEGQPNPCHTTSDVPLIVVDSSQRGRMVKRGHLSAVGPLILDLMGLSKPDAMTRDSLWAE